MIFLNKSYILFTLLFFVIISFGNAQTKDTLIIKFDDNYSEMEKAKKYIYTNSAKDSVYMYFYYMYFPNRKKQLSFLHHVQSPKTIEYFDNGFVNPITKIVNKNYLKGKRILDISYFKNTSRKTIEKFLKDKKTFLFLYEVGERKDDKIVLREVFLKGYIQI